MTSPRNLLTRKPATRARSSGSSKASVPTNAASTPPRSMSPTSSTGASASRAMRMFTISPADRLISAGLPAPSMTMRSWVARSRARLAATAEKSSPRRSPYSRNVRLPIGTPWTTTCERSSPSGFRRIGFMSTVGSTPAASAWAAWARPISRPSGVTAAFRDMFCALNGATRYPRRAKIRHSAAVSWSIRHGAVMRDSVGGSPPTVRCA